MNSDMFEAMGGKPTLTIEELEAGLRILQTPASEPLSKEDSKDLPTTEVTRYWTDSFRMVLAVHAAVRIEGSQKAAAAKWGISPQYLSDILRGWREVPDKVAALFGLAKRTVYLPRDGDAQAFYGRLLDESDAPDADEKAVEV